MQVKKFEARTMKEALDMVKTQLGPDAIILSARDNKNGLVGEGSVEITAAVSDLTLQKKKFVESRLGETDREKFNKSPARQQKEIIEKAVNRHLEVAAQDKKNIAMKSAIRSYKQPSTRRYADIEDDDQPQMSSQDIKLNPANQKTRDVAQKAWKEMTGGNSEMSSLDMSTLKSEIASLKRVITEFQKTPQSMQAASHPGIDYGVERDFAFMFEKLTDNGVNSIEAATLVGEVQSEVPASKKTRNNIEIATVQKLIEKISVTSQDLDEKMHLFLGPSGAGKTASLIKLATQLVLKEKKRIAIVTTDTFKIGAIEQLKICAQILNIPFVVVKNQSEWQAIYKGLSYLDAVLVDFPGLSLKTNDDINLLKDLLPRGAADTRTHLVLSCLSKDQDLAEICKRYSNIHFDDLIFTSLDETSIHGNIYNIAQKTKVPLFAFGIGPRVPEDFEPATKERLVDLILKITQTQNQDMVNL